MVIAKSLKKSFGEFNAVDGLNLRINKGECFGLLGPNGAGKSTFISMTYGASQRTSGELTLFGLDPAKNNREIKKRMGVVTQENALDESLTVIENMLIYCAFLGIPKNERHSRVDELLEYMNLAHKKDALIQTLSGGMKRRLVFVRALLGKPELLILDEPTTGLDPAVRHLLWGKVKELHQNGTTIILTTHYMHEAEVLCNRLVIMNKGQVVGSGSPKELINMHTSGYVGLFSIDDEKQIEPLIKNQKNYNFHKDSSGIYLRTDSLSDLTQIHEKYNLTPLQIRPSNLEDVFLKLTGQEMTADA